MKRRIYHVALLTLLVSFALLQAAVAADTRWWMREGKGDALCETLYKELQKYRPEDLGSCTGSVALALPGMKEMDGWKELFKKILQYQALGVQPYFGTMSPEAFKKVLQYQERLVRGTPGAQSAQTYFGTTPTTTTWYLQGDFVKRKTISDENLEKHFQNFLAVGGRMRVKTLQLMRHPGMFPTDVTYEQPQTLLELRSKWSRTDCPKSPSLNEAVETIYVTADLSGPDPGILDGERSEASNAQIVVYKDSIYLMYTSPGGDGIMFSHESSYRDLQRTCVIQR